MAAIALALAGLTLLAWARPNATQPDLAPRGWGPGSLVPLTLSSGAVTAIMVASYVVGVAGLWWAWRRGIGPVRWWIPLLLAAIALLGAPIGSGDHLNYAAYGRIALEGGDPYTASPIAWQDGSDPITSRVEQPWTEAPSVYGPLATQLQQVAAAVGGDNLRQVVWVWQLIVVAGWLLMRFALRRSLSPHLHGRIDVLWTLNPLLFAHALLGAHVDTIAAALAVSAVAACAWRRDALGLAMGGALAAAAGSVKFPYAVVALGLLLAYCVRERSVRSIRLGRAGALVGGFVAVAGILHLISGPTTYAALAKARSSVSLATPWRLLLEALRDPLGSGTTRTLITVGAAVVAVLIVIALVRVTSPAEDTAPARALWLTGCLSAAYALAAPYALPWYDLLAWGALPAMAGATATVILGARLLLMSLAYTPGRVLGMSAEVESFTLGFRRYVAPWLALVVWAAILQAWRQRQSRHAQERR